MTPTPPAPTEVERLREVERLSTELLLGEVGDATDWELADLRNRLNRALGDPLDIEEHSTDAAIQRAAYANVAIDRPGWPWPPPKPGG